MLPSTHTQFLKSMATCSTTLDNNIFPNSESNVSNRRYNKDFCYHLQNTDEPQMQNSFMKWQHMSIDKLNSSVEMHVFTCRGWDHLSF